MIRATVDMTEVDRGIDSLTAAARDKSPVYKELRKPLRQDQAEHAKRREGPAGKWPAKSPFTLAREARARKRAGKKRGSRRLLGKLPSAIAVKADRNKVVAYSRVRWSSIHQDGGAAGRGAKIPARPFLWASQKLLEKARELFENHILGRW